MAGNFLERFHDPTVQRQIFIQQIVAYIVDFLKPFRILGIQSERQLSELKNTIEMDVYKHGVNTGNWDRRELPLIVKIFYEKGKMHVDFNGPLGGEIYVAMEDYLNFNRSIGPVEDAWVNDDDDDEGYEPEEASEFKYGR
jgi:hypothetical protein